MRAAPMPIIDGEVGVGKPLIAVDALSPLPSSPTLEFADDQRFVGKRQIDHRREARVMKESAIGDGAALARGHARD